MFDSGNFFSVLLTKINLILKLCSKQSAFFLTETWASSFVTVRSIKTQCFPFLIVVPGFKFHASSQFLNDLYLTARKCVS